MYGEESFIYKKKQSLIFDTNNSLDSDTTNKKSQNSITTNKQKLFGNLYTGFYYGLSENVKPRAAFELSTALLGYSNRISEKVKATIIFDVTRTTNNIQVNDTSGNNLDVSFFEGSKYTAFLKMAEINYEINEFLDFSVGQLLNTQYLTFQDKFWGYRYIYVTFQEAYRYGMPADFGAQLNIKYKNIYKNSFSIVNGEGPFYYQDENSKFLISNNVEIHAKNGVILKFYTDYAPPSDTASELKSKSVISLFAGYKTDNFRIGAEYNHVYNYNFIIGNDYYGTSVYGSYKLDNTEILARYDYINKSTFITEGHYIIAGCQFNPADKFYISINFRNLLPDNKTQLYFNFGIKF